VGAVAGWAAPAVLTARKTDSRIVIGAGEDRYEVLHDWARLPDPWEWQTTHNVALDRDDFLYVIHEGRADRRDHPAIFVFDPQGRYEGMVFLARDVTRDRSMDRLKSDFISVAAHELRTPLATILGFSELLLDNNPGKADRLEYTRAIYEKTDTLSRLLDDMLDISRIESGRGLELFVEKIQVDDLIMPVIRQYQKRETNRKFEVDIDDSDQLVLADPDKIAQVLENLLSNAVKYSDPGSLIHIGGKSSVNGYLLSISDEGLGMTPEQIKHAFDKFYRGNNVDKAVKGTGIGLTIVKHIIEEHEGTVSIESRPGKGSRFSFTLPIV
jgi:signal transduction histidine kinase